MKIRPQYNRRRGINGDDMEIPAWVEVLMGFALSAVLLFACIEAAHADAPDEFYDINVELGKNWTPIRQNQAFEVLTFPDPHRPFEGDCDDFAGAGARALYEQGFFPNFVVLNKRWGMGRHTIVCAEDWCLDSDVPYPYHRRVLRDRYGTIIADIPIPTHYLEPEDDE